MSQETLDLLRKSLEALAPIQLEIHDESHLHAGHAGAQSGGGHYRIMIVAKIFQGKSALARHQLIYDSVGPLMQGQIHALAIRALAPEEA